MQSLRYENADECASVLKIHTFARFINEKYRMNPRQRPLTLLMACKNAAFPTFCCCLLRANSILRFSCSMCRRFSSSFIRIVDNLVASTMGRSSSTRRNEITSDHLNAMCFATFTVAVRLLIGGRLLLPCRGVWKRCE